SVYFSGELNEAGREIVFLRLPRQIKRIDGNAVTTETGARIKGRISKRFGSRGVNDFPDIDAHSVGQQFELIHESDVYGTVNVLEQFHQFCRAGRGDGHDFINHLRIQGLSDLETRGRGSSHNLGDGSRRELRVTRILAFRRK